MSRKESYHMVLPREHCRKCGYQWVPRVENPVQCPRCQSPRFREPKGPRKPWKPATAAKRGGSGP
jgi:predicted Zn-ribbon and HTH transcriptional regulator